MPIAPDQPKKTLGCWVKPLLLSLVSLALAIWMMSNWDSLPGIAKAGSVMLVIIGTLILLPIIVWLIFTFWIKRLTRGLKKDMTGIVNAGKHVLHLQKQLYGVSHTYRGATEEDFLHICADMYIQSTKVFESLGFRHTGDIVNVTLADAGRYSPVIRTMILGNETGGTTYSGFYDCTSLRGLKAPSDPMFTYDLATEFSDGTFLLTSNTAGSDLSTPPLQFHRQQFPREIPIPDLVAAHESMKAQLLAAHPERTCVTIATLEDIHAAERLQHHIKSVFRREMGDVDAGMVQRAADAMDVDAETADLTIRSMSIARDSEKQPGQNTSGDKTQS